MKVVLLNINSGGGKRIVAIRDFIDGHDPEVVVLTEWRDTAGGRSFNDWAIKRGMQCAALNDGATANGIFVASRDSFAVESRTPPGKTCAGVLMQIRFFQWTMLACYFPQLEAKASFFDAALRITSENQAIPFLLLGDLNTGNQIADRSPTGDKYSCAQLFDALTGQGRLVDLWRRTSGMEAREWTWLSRTRNGFRIDHAFVNDAYLRSRSLSCSYDHTSRSMGISDHSALIIEG
jgi:exonuclease III